MSGSSFYSSGFDMVMHYDCDAEADQRYADDGNATQQLMPSVR